MKKILLLLLITFTGAFAQGDVVKFKAVIKNPNSDSLVIRAQTFKKVIKADAKGVFNDSFSVTPGIYQLFDGAEYATLYLKNGYDLHMTMDAVMFDESIAFKGKGAAENNYLAKKALNDEAFGIELNEAMNLDGAGFEKMIADRNNKVAKALEDKSLDENFRAMQLKLLDGEKKQLQMMATQAVAASNMKGKASPGFTYENHKGGTTSLADLKGKYVYLDIWATWCGPCIQEIPHLQAIEKKYHDKKIEFVSISVDEEKDHEKWKKFVSNRGLGGIQLYADKDWSSDFIKAYNIIAIPRFILIGPDGNVIDADAARPSNPVLQEQLNKLLK